MADCAGSATLRPPATTSTPPRARRATRPTRSARRSPRRDATASATLADSGGQLSSEVTQRGDSGGPVAARLGVGQGAHQGGPDDDTVGEGADLGRLGTGGDAEPDADRLVGRGTGPGDELLGGVADRRAGAGDPHDRGGVDEAAAGLGGAAQALVGRARCDEEDPVEVVPRGGVDPLLALVRDEVGGDEPGATG